MNGLRLPWYVVWMMSLRRFSKASGGSWAFHARSTDTRPTFGAEPFETASFTSRSGQPSPPS